jgi:endonuclease/exonuclease/phosphatase (EEP) superfamily protein YafD
MAIAEITDADACAAAIGRAQARPMESLATGTIRLLNWNVHKSTESELHADMARLTDGADLILLQEATRGLARQALLRDGYHLAFAPGYKSSRADSGVLTVSKATPLTQCSFRYSEPWLRSPKATSVTAYSLGSRDETLLVINLHMVNFTIGLADFRMQLDEVLEVIEAHDGPAIVSGDFNTWSKLRHQAVGRALRSLDLLPIRYRVDMRKRAFGNALDHVYVREMEVVSGTSHAVGSSDHNPISAVLKF